jgi:hypothetical protein
MSSDNSLNLFKINIIFIFNNIVNKTVKLVIFITNKNIIIKTIFFNYLWVLKILYINIKLLNLITKNKIMIITS